MRKCGSTGLYISCKAASLQIVPACAAVSCGHVHYVDGERTAGRHRSACCHTCCTRFSPTQHFRAVRGKTRCRTRGLGGVLGHCTGGIRAADRLSCGAALAPTNRASPTAHSLPRRKLLLLSSPRAPTTSANAAGRNLVTARQHTAAGIARCNPRVEGFKSEHDWLPRPRWHRSRLLRLCVAKSAR